MPKEARQRAISRLASLHRDPDAIAYPGNRKSDDPETGEVYGIVNSVFVKTTKERILDEPSGIAYAIPIRYAKALLEAADYRRGKCKSLQISYFSLAFASVSH